MGRRFGVYQSIIDRFKKDEASLKPNVRRSIEKLRKIMASFPEAAKEMSIESLKKKDRLIRVKIGVLESRLKITLLSESDLDTGEKFSSGGGCSNSSSNNTDF
jgi:hypothetical protein